MFQQEKKYLSGGINADDAPFAVAEGELINAVNHHFGNSENGSTSINESISGNNLLPVGFPTLPLVGTNKIIGSASDEVNRRIVYFLWNSNNNHQIRCYDIVTGTNYLVMSQYHPAPRGLSFDYNSRINKAYIVGSMLYWTDNFNEPRRINIDAGIGFNTSGTFNGRVPYSGTLNETDITIIRPTSNIPPLVRKLKSSDIPSLTTYTQNLIKNYAFQFSIRYYYRDNEKSVLGPWSKLMGYNYPDSDNNVIEVKAPFDIYISDEILVIELAVRFGNFGNGFIIRQWDKTIAADAAQIALHNGGTSPLLYYFTNEATGPAISPVDLNKSADSVALKNKAISVAKNRLFLGNGLFGYNSPVITSLSLTNDNIPTTGGLAGVWYIFNVTWLSAIGISVILPTIFIDLGSGVTKRYVFIAELARTYSSIDYGTRPVHIGTVNPSFVFPANVPGATITIRSDDLNDIAIAATKLDGTLSVANPAPTFSTPVTTTNSVFITNSLATDTTRVFKSNSSYRGGIVFFDRFRRVIGGVVSNGSLKRSIPQRTSDQLALTAILRWNLSNTAAINEIPVEAYYYSIVLTKNLTTDFFFQGHPHRIRYVLKDDNGVLSFTQNTYLAYAYGIAIDISEMINVGIGYTYTEGDLLTLYLGSNVYNVNVIGQASKWVICSLANVGVVGSDTVGSTLNDVVGIFELWTPHKESINEGYFEIGENYNILNPGQPTRVYSQLSGVLNGDVYSIARQSVLTTDVVFSYVVEAMSPNDKYWKNWYTDAGWFYIVDKIGQHRRSNSVSWSNVLIPGTRTNGLSSFDPLDTNDLPIQNGELNSLVLASKVQDEGTVMLAICKNETCSLYLGETQILDNTGTNSILTTSTSVIGTVNILKGGFGTSHAETVQHFRGEVYYFDVINGTWVQYSSNGLFPISNYKLTKFSKKFSRKYLISGSTDAVPGGIDPLSENYICTIPQVESGGYAGTLPTFADINEFDIYDGVGKTVAFKLGLQKFISTYTYMAEHFEYCGTDLFSFFQGNIYRHNDNSVPDNYFYGSLGTTKLMFLSNSNPSKVKVYSNIAVQSNMAPIRAIFYSLDPYEQITDLVGSDFTFKEGVYYANLYRDRLDPNAAGTPDQKLYNAKKIRSSALMCQLEFDVSAIKLELKFVNIGYHISEGHST